MKLTVQDIYNFPELDKLTLIAGHGGLKNQVTHCGILDYEYDKDVSSKYYDYNYQVDGGFLTLTTFLYAKNDPNLIYDAVKKLVAKNGSGLIIKNIFKLPISDNVIRYANHMNFPIFILNDSYPFFEDIIVLISKAMEKYDSVYYREQKVTALLASDENDIAQISRLVYEINPSLQEELLTAYFKYESGYLSTQMYLRTEEKLYARGVIAPEDSIFLYKDGFLLIHSSRHFTIPDISKLLKPYFNALGDNLADDYVVGISKIHSVKEELGTAIRESLCAALFACEDGDFATTFDSLGPYQAIVPYCNDSAMKSYARDYILPLEKYDSEKNGEILSTVIEFVKRGGDLEKTAEKISQHKNTVRNRLNRAGSLLSLNPFSLGGYERLALAVRIHICAGKEK